MTQWIFDPPPLSGAVTGGVTAQHVFEGDLDTFVREVLQNSIDQRIGSDPVHVRFAFHELTGPAKRQFLEGLHWVQLGRHLEGVVREGGPFGRRVRDALAELEGEPLRLLRIDDWNTRGLTGGEDERHENFAALCRHLLITSEEHGERGGSYGLGKAVLGNFSAFSTVLFSSRLSGAEAGRVRFIGKADLPYHVVGEEEFRGPGWFGSSEQRNGGARATSVWDDSGDEAVRRLRLSRPCDWGSGTSIMLVAFAEPEVEERRDLKIIAGELTEAAAKWFWPALCIPPAKMQVEVEICRNEEQTYHAIVEPTPEIQPYVEAVLATDAGPHASVAGEIGEHLIEVGIPARREPPRHDELSSPAIFRVARKPEEVSASTIANRVAAFRGPGMIVAYVRPSKTPLDDAPFYGVLRVGTAAGDTDSHHNAERFFRAAEPPAHNEWAITQNLRVDYRRGAGVRLKSLWADVDSALLKLCGRTAPPGAEGPELLQKYFPVGGVGGGSTEVAHFRTTGLSAELTGGRWDFSGQIARQGGDDSDWSFQISLWLEGESGRGSRVDIARLIVGPATSTQAVSDGGVRVVRVDKGQQTVSFHGSSTRITDVDAGLTRLRIEVRGKREA